MAADALRKTRSKMQRYRFIVGVSLAALEAELNAVVNDDPYLVLRELTYAQGTGFVAVVEHLEGDDPVRKEQTERTEEPGKTVVKRRPRMKP